MTLEVQFNVQGNVQTINVDLHRVKTTNNVFNVSINTSILFSAS